MSITLHTNKLHINDFNMSGAMDVLTYETQESLDAIRAQIDPENGTLTQEVEEFQNEWNNKKTIINNKINSIINETIPNIITTIEGANGNGGIKGDLENFIEEKKQDIMGINKDGNGGIEGAFTNFIANKESYINLNIKQPLEKYISDRKKDIQGLNEDGNGGIEGEFNTFIENKTQVVIPGIKSNLISFISEKEGYINNTVKKGLTDFIDQKEKEIKGPEKDGNGGIESDFTNFINNTLEDAYDELDNKWDQISQEVDTKKAQVLSSISTVPELQNMIIDAFSNKRTYEIGDYCTYNNILYKCITAITVKEEWDSTHWIQVNLGNEISDLQKSNYEILNPTWSYGVRINDSYNISTNIKQKAVSEMYYCSPNDVFINESILREIPNDNNSPILGLTLAVYDKDLKPISQKPISLPLSSNVTRYTFPENSCFFSITYGYNLDQDKQLTSEMVNSHFRAHIVRANKNNILNNTKILSASDLNFKQGFTLNFKGQFGIDENNTNKYYLVSDFIECSEGDIIIDKSPMVVEKSDVSYILFYKDGIFQNYVNIKLLNKRGCRIPEGINGIRMRWGYLASTENMRELTEDKINSLKFQFITNNVSHQQDRENKLDLILESQLINVALSYYNASENGFFTYGPLGNFYTDKDFARKDNDKSAILNPTYNPNSQIDSERKEYLTITGENTTDTALTNENRQLTIKEVREEFGPQVERAIITEINCSNGVFNIIAGIPFYNSKYNIDCNQFYSGGYGFNPYAYGYNLIQKQKENLSNSNDMTPEQIAINTILDVDRGKSTWNDPNNHFVNWKNINYTNFYTTEAYRYTWYLLNAFYRWGFVKPELIMFDSTFRQAGDKDTYFAEVARQLQPGDMLFWGQRKTTNKTDEAMLNKFPTHSEDYYKGADEKNGNYDERGVVWGSYYNALIKQYENGAKTPDDENYSRRGASLRCHAWAVNQIFAELWADETKRDKYLKGFNYGPYVYRDSNGNPKQGNPEEDPTIQSAEQYLLDEFGYPCLFFIHHVDIILKQHENIWYKFNAGGANKLKPITIKEVDTFPNFPSSAFLAVARVPLKSTERLDNIIMGK